MVGGRRSEAATGCPVRADLRLIWLCLMICFAPAPGLAAEAVATRAAVTAAAATTEFTLDLTAGVKAEVFTLANPYRVVVDLPDVAFRLDPGAGQAAAGLVQAFRYGAFADKRARIVIDTAGPVGIAKAEMKNLSSGVRLTVALTPMDAAAFGRGTGAERSANGLPPVKPGVFEDTGRAGTRLKPIVMIDPGHGGIDPGAIGANKTTEKTVVLAVARELKALLDATGRYDARLTRSSDTFIPLDRRVQMSVEAQSDLFVSLHADAVDGRNLAQSIRGASIYTLSDKASDEQARLMAEKENAADLAAGIEQSQTEHSDDIKNILFDLLARETAAFSHVVSRTLVGTLSRTSALAREPERAAAFRVLKQTHSPSVLIELGFLSNHDEEQKMSKPAWQRQIAGSIASAIELYFARRKSNTANAPVAAGAGGLPP